MRNSLLIMYLLLRHSFPRKTLFAHLIISEVRTAFIHAKTRLDYEIKSHAILTLTTSDKITFTSIEGTNYKLYLPRRLSLSLRKIINYLYISVSKSRKFN